MVLAFGMYCTYVDVCTAVQDGRLIGGVSVLNSTGMGSIVQE